MTRATKFALLAALTAAVPAAAQPTSAPTAPHVHEALAAGPAQDGSIYPLTTALETQAGEKQPLSLAKGHPVIIAMFFARCTSACPILIRDVKKIEAALEPDVRAQVRVLLVSFDFARDDPGALTKLATEHAVDPTRWTFARARDDEATRELAGALGVKYRRLENGDYNHSSVITALDAQGAPIARIEGLAQDSTALRAALTAAARPAIPNAPTP